MEEAKPKGRVIVVCMSDVEMKPSKCARDGCKQQGAKFCSFYRRDGVRCHSQMEYCVHHFYRHLAKEHPGEYENRFGRKPKELP